MSADSGPAWPMEGDLASVLSAKRNLDTSQPQPSYVPLAVSAMSAAEKRRLLSLTPAAGWLLQSSTCNASSIVAAPAPESTGGTPVDIDASGRAHHCAARLYEEALAIHVVSFAAAAPGPSGGPTAAAIALLTYDSVVEVEEGCSPVHIALCEGAVMDFKSSPGAILADFTPAPPHVASTDCVPATACTHISLSSPTSRCAGRADAPRCSLAVAVDARRSRVTVRRSYVTSLPHDGHMLALGLRTPDLKGGGAVTFTVSTCDETGATGGALRDVVCPTHDVHVAGLGTANVSGVIARAGSAGRGGRNVGRHHDHVDAATVSSLAQFESTCLLLLEPHNLACGWAPHVAALAPNAPDLLQRAYLAAVAALQRGAVPTPVAQPSPHPTLPATALPSAPPVALLPSHLPRHVAIVMDGNGRWARSRCLSRSDGHRAGVSAIHAVIRACRRLGVPFLTLYAFSQQNWSRPPDEVATLMRLLVDFVHTDCEELIANGVRLLVNGDMARLPAIARSGLNRLVGASRHNRGLTLILALSYGGREEIVAAVAAACTAAAAGALKPADVTVDRFRSFLPHPDVPDPDLLIRTSGELRISNFLLWHIAYTELYVTDTLWPDFDDAALVAALTAYAGRERRFGLTSAQIAEGQQSFLTAAVQLVASAPPAGQVQAGDSSWWLTHASSLYAWYSRKPAPPALAAAVAAPPADTSSDDAPQLQRRRRKAVRRRLRRDDAPPLQVTQGGMSCSAPLFMLALLPLLLLASTLGYLARTSAVAGMADAWAHATAHPPGAVEVPLCRLQPFPERTALHASADDEDVHVARVQASAHPQESPTMFATQRLHTSAWWGTMTGVVRHAACSMTGCMHTGLAAGTPLPSRGVPMYDSHAPSQGVVTAGAAGDAE